MFSRLGGALAKRRIFIGCISLLGISLGAGLTNSEINGSYALSGLFGIMSAWFNSTSSSSSPSSTVTTSWNPWQHITFAWDKVSTVSSQAVESFSTGYAWIKQSQNFQLVVEFLKNFWNHVFIEDLVFNLHTTIRSWLGVLIEKDMLGKFPNAFKKFKILSSFLSTQNNGQQQEEKNMVNWLYLRFFVNPRRTLNVLTRGTKVVDSGGIEKLKCNGQKKKKKKKENNLPLGVCFVENGAGGSGTNFKLINHMSTFLKTGKIPQETTSSQK